MARSELFCSKRLQQESLSVPYKHRIAPHIEDILKEVVDLVAGVADELSDEELGYLVRNTLVKIVDEQYETEPFKE